MRAEVATSKSWSDQFMPAVKRQLGMVLLAETTEFEDQHEAADLKVLQMRAITIGVRIRKTDDWKYNSQFTIRCWRPSNVTTELQKILDGWANVFFYGWANSRLVAYRIFDLAKFRTRYTSPHWHEDHQNRPRDSDLRAFRVSEFADALMGERCLPEMRAAAPTWTAFLPAVPGGQP